jgi:uncharacterized membrane protein YagU involved in acid resistance
MSTTIAPRRPFWITAIAGLVAGTLDLSFAFIFYGSYGTSPARLLSGIASGVLGPDASTMGGWSVVLGAVLHFFTSLCAAFVYLRVSRNVPLLTRQPLPCGAGFGVAMYIFMHFVVIPLSRFPFHLPSTRSLVGELLSHIVLFGMVIAVGVARATKIDGGADQARGLTPDVPH